MGLSSDKKMLWMVLIILLKKREKETLDQSKVSDFKAKTEVLHWAGYLLQ
jgi:hypothetical protein